MNSETMKAFAWKDGYQAKIDPNVAGEMLEKIHKKHGHLSADIVLESARPKNSPLHPQVFDKSQKDAAEAYYRNQARLLITHIVVVTEKTEPIRAYIPVSAERTKNHKNPTIRFRRTVDAVHNEHEMKFTLEKAKAELDRAFFKYASIKGLRNVVEDLMEKYGI